MGADPKYKVGQLGLNLVASPLHLTEDALLVAENVEVVRDAGVGGIGSRRGLKPFHPDGLGGIIVSMFNVPLDSEGFGGGGGDVLQALFQFTNGEEESVWYGTDDAVSFVEQASPAQAPNEPADIGNRGQGFATLDGVMYYISGSGSAATIWSWDGITNEEVIDSFPGDVGYTLFGVFNLLAANGVLYISTLFNGMGDNRTYVYEWDGATLTQVGEPITGTSAEMVPVGLAFCFDLLFVGNDDTNGDPEVYRITPGPGAWTLDETFAAGLSLHWLEVYADELYASFAPAVIGGGTNGTVRVRNSGGSWNESFAGPDDDAEFVGPMIVFGDELYLAWGNRVTPRQNVYRFDGDSWILDLNVITEFSLDGTVLRRGKPIVVADCLLWTWFDIDVSSAADIFKRNAAAEWVIALENEVLGAGVGGI